MAERTRNLQQQVADLWTTQDLRKLFGREPMTVHLWRKNRGLPAVIIPGDDRPSVRYDPGDVLEWATREGIKVNGRLRLAA